MTSNNANNSTPIDGFLRDVHTFDTIITGRVRSEVNSVMDTVETRTHDAILTAVKRISKSCRGRANKSVNVSFGEDIDSVVPDPDQKDFSGNIEGHQITTLSKLNSNTALNMIDESRGNFTVEVIDLSVNERNFDRHTHSHHGITQFFGDKTTRTECILHKKFVVAKHRF